jgi:adenosine kinase
MMNIYISGSLAFDRIMTFNGYFKDHILPEKVHILNVSFMVDGMTEKQGGTAGNIAYSLALLGEKPYILAAAGKDFGGYGEYLRALGLPLDGIRIMQDMHTATCYITTDLSRNQITGFHPAAMIVPCEYKFTGLQAGDMAIISPGNLDDMNNFPGFYRSKNVRYIFDPGQQIPVLSRDQLLSAINGAYMLIVNDYELEMVSKTTQKSHAELAGLCSCLIVTLGENGSRIMQGGQTTQVGIARPSAIVDPTGCGDAYRSGLLKGLAAGMSMEQSAQLGATAASFCIETGGTQLHTFTLAEFKSRHKDNFGYMPAI